MLRLLGESVIALIIVGAVGFAYFVVAIVSGFIVEIGIYGDGGPLTPNPTWQTTAEHLVLFVGPFMAGIGVALLVTAIRFPAFPRLVLDAGFAFAFAAAGLLTGLIVGGLALSEMAGLAVSIYFGGAAGFGLALVVAVHLRRQTVPDGQHVPPT